MVLSWVYAIWGGIGFVQGLFFGLKAAVLAIVLQAVIRVGSRALTSRPKRLIAAAAFMAIFLFHVPFPWIIVAAGVAGALAVHFGIAGFAGPGHGGAGKGLADRDSLLGEALPVHARSGWRHAFGTASFWLMLWLGPVAALWLIQGPDDIFTQIATFFSRMAVVTFGGAYAVLAYVAQQAVEIHGWLEPGEMLDGLGMAETTPGPLIMVTQFVGFMGALRSPGAMTPIAAATLGGLLTTWVTFVPCFLWIFLGAPWVEALRGNMALGGALAAITAAVVGVILNLALWFGLHTMFARTLTWEGAGMRIDLPVPASASMPAIALAALAVFAIFRLRLGVLVDPARQCADRNRAAARRGDRMTASLCLYLNGPRIPDGPGSGPTRLMQNDNPGDAMLSVCKSSQGQTAMSRVTQSWAMRAARVAPVIAAAAAS